MVGHDRSSAVATRTPHPEPPAGAGESKDNAASVMNAHVYILAAERQLKGWSRAKKEALIAGNYDLLHELARYRRRVSRPDPSTRAYGAARDEDGPA